MLLDLFEASGCVLVKQARDQGLVGESLGQRSPLDRLQVLARQADVQPSILAERGLCVTGVPGACSLTPVGRLPLAALGGFQQLLLVGIKFHRRLPLRGTASSPSGSG